MRAVRIGGKPDRKGELVHATAAGQAVNPVQRIITHTAIDTVPHTRRCARSITAKLCSVNVIVAVPAQQRIRPACAPDGAIPRTTVLTVIARSCNDRVIPRQTAQNIVAPVGHDQISYPRADKNIVAAAEDGRIVQIATLGGMDVRLNIARMMMKRVTLTGSTLRPRTRDVKAGFAKALEQKVWPLIAAGKVKVVMDSTFGLAHAADAHRRMETSEHIGKIVLTV